MLLEESRIEAAHIRRRPDDRHWLRASTTTDPADTLDRRPPPTRASGRRDSTQADAAQRRRLLLARVDAGILTAAEAEPVADVVDDRPRRRPSAELRGIWQAAHRAADDDAETMLELGRRWCDDPRHRPRPDRRRRNRCRAAPGDGTGDGRPASRTGSDAVGARRWRGVGEALGPGVAIAAE